MESFEYFQCYNPFWDIISDEDAVNAIVTRDPLDAYRECVDIPPTIYTYQTMVTI